MQIDAQYLAAPLLSPMRMPQSCMASRRHLATSLQKHIVIFCTLFQRPGSRSLTLMDSASMRSSLSIRAIYRSPKQASGLLVHHALREKSSLPHPP